MSAKKKSAQPDATPPAPAPAAPVRYWESRLSAKLGVARKRLMALRRSHLREGEHWMQDARTRAVVLTETGLEKLRDVLASQGWRDPAATAPAAPVMVPNGPPERVKARVARIYPNKRLMLCVALTAPETGLLTRVRDNTNFMPGMLLEIIGGQDNSWQYSGRLPRRRGKW